MATRIASITAEIEIPPGQDYDETVEVVLGEIEDGIRRTGQAYRLSVQVTACSRRALTPVTITERYPAHRAGRVQAWAAVSDDGLWTYNRVPVTGTPWEITYVPTGESYQTSSLPKARTATASGSALAYLEVLRKQEAERGADR